MLVWLLVSAVLFAYKHVGVVAFKNLAAALVNVEFTSWKKKTFEASPGYL
jgi:NADH:ubiquinone oxidoreductase subunit K